MSASSPASSGKDGAIAWARSLMGRTDWVILDTETTGLGSTDVVIQIGVTDHRGVTLVDTLVRPAVAIGSGAQAVHGISAEAVAGARDFPTVLPELVRAIAGKTVVAYNAPFDRRLLDQTAVRHGGDTAGGTVGLRDAAVHAVPWRPVGEAARGNSRGDGGIAWRRWR